MKAAIHQPQYFPWLGYLDKIAKVELFVLMDEVQFGSRSYMTRNRFLRKDGELNFLTITVAKKGYQDKKNGEIETIDNAHWQRKHLAYLRDLYSKSPYRDEILDRIMPVFRKDYRLLFDVLRDSILCCMDILDIHTEIITQSSLSCRRDGAVDLEKNERRSEDVLAICQAAGATAYMTGSGASLSFLNMDHFSAAGIPAVIQDYQCPQYPQMFSKEFIPNISSLDLFFNCGIEESRRIFWENVHRSHEFDGIEGKRCNSST